MEHHTTHHHHSAAPASPTPHRHAQGPFTDAEINTILAGLLKTPLSTEEVMHDANRTVTQAHELFENERVLKVTTTLAAIADQRARILASEAVIKSIFMLTNIMATDILGPRHAETLRKCATTLLKLHEAYQKNPTVVPSVRMPTIKPPRAPRPNRSPRTPRPNTAANPITNPADNSTGSPDTSIPPTQPTSHQPHNPAPADTSPSSHRHRSPVSPTSAQATPHRATDLVKALRREVSADPSPAPSPHRPPQTTSPAHPHDHLPTPPDVIDVTPSVRHHEPGL